MAGAERRARVRWEGPVAQGAGTMSLLSSEVLRDAGVTWAARTEQPEGKTSPEELLAGAHAACYCMAFAAYLGRTASPPEHLDVECRVTFEPKQGGGWRVATSTLQVSGRVPDMDDEAFAEAARTAEQGCPISNAIRGNVEISVEVVT